MQKIRSVLDKIMHIFNVAVFAILTILTTWQVVTRYFLNNPSTWSEELGSYLFAWVTLLGAAYVFGKRDHMDIPVVVERFSVKIQRIIGIVSEVIILLFAAVVLVYGGIAITSLSMIQSASSMPVQMGVFYSVIPISGVFTIIYNILNIYDLAKGKPIGIETDEEEKEEEITSSDSHG